MRLMRMLEALRTAPRLLVLDKKNLAIARWIQRRGDRARAGLPSNLLKRVAR